MQETNRMFQKANHTRQAKQWTKITISNKAQEASYAVVEIMAKKMNNIQLLSQQFYQHSVKS
jgi:hypothetical protein